MIENNILVYKTTNILVLVVVCVCVEGEKTLFITFHPNKGFRVGNEARGHGICSFYKKEMLFL